MWRHESFVRRTGRNDSADRIKKRWNAASGTADDSVPLILSFTRPHVTRYAEFDRQRAIFETNTTLLHASSCRTLHLYESAFGIHKRRTMKTKMSYVNLNLGKNLARYYAATRHKPFRIISLNALSCKV